MRTLFKSTIRFCYQFSRNQVLPEIIALLTKESPLVNYRNNSNF